MESLEAHLDAEISELVASADSEEFAAGLERFFAGRGVDTED
jgi:hypothetical protein